jgi:hypothetical protein
LNFHPYNGNHFLGRPISITKIKQEMNIGKGEVGEKSGGNLPKKAEHSKSHEVHKLNQKKQPKFVKYLSLDQRIGGGRGQQLTATQIGNINTPSKPNDDHRCNNGLHRIEESIDNTKKELEIMKL